MNTLSGLQIDLLVNLIERKILRMVDGEMFEKAEIQILKDCRDCLKRKDSLSGNQLEHAIDLVEIRILCAAADGDTDGREFAQLKACRAVLLEIAAERRDVRVVPFPSIYLLEDRGEDTVH